MVDVQILDGDALEQFLERRRASPQAEMSLAGNLVEVLRKANEFVPSDAGSILLDNPREKVPERNLNFLTFIAAFGEKADLLVGQRIPAAKGVAGHVYLSGKPYHTSDLGRDAFFYGAVDKATEYRSQSLVAIPIRIGNDVCGVLELVNRQGSDGFSEQDRNLLDIFAGYISIAIQNVLDGRLAQEIARRDNLTGLYNDRFLHLALERAILESRESGRDLALVFLDLDYFKRVNDQHGHLAGSQVLREVGHLLRRVVCDPEAQLARYGGDEFVLALPGLELQDAVAVAEEVRSEIVATTFCDTAGEIQHEPLHLSGLTASIGVATLLRHCADEHDLAMAKSTLLRLSDAAMYVAKETGRNRTAVAGEPVRRRLHSEASAR